MEMHSDLDAVIAAEGESSILIRRELDYLDEAEKYPLLYQAGIGVGMDQRIRDISERMH